MKILIVGAGIAGPTLAYWLLRGGHEPTLVERAPALRTGGHLIDFWGAGFEVADGMGIVPALLERQCTPSEAHQERRDGTLMFSFHPESLVGRGARYASLARSDLAAVIYQALHGRVETLFGDSVTTIEDDGARVHVGFERARARDFDLVIGADGLHSQVRRLVFGTRAPGGAVYENYLGFKVAAFELPGSHSRGSKIAKLYTEVGCQVTTVPVRDDSSLFLFTFLDEGDEVPETRADQEALLRDRFARAGWEVPRILNQMPRAPSIYLDRVSQVRMPSWTRGRVALVGDAGSCPSLLSGQGSALAMVEAYVLAAELARAPSHAEAFKAYEARLLPFVRAKQRAAERLALSFAPKNGVQLFVRNSVMRLMASPFIAKLAVGNSMFDKIELPPAPAV